MNRPPSWLNVPNALSLYRVATAPVILYSLFSGQRLLFAWLIIINLVTDALDGFIARHWHLETAIGTRLDSVGDLMTDILALCGLVYFELPFVRSHIVALGLLFGASLAPQLLSLLRLRRLVSMHLYLRKLTNILLTVFFTAYFLVAYSPVLFYTMIGVGILTGIEELAVLCLVNEHRENVRGLFWVLKEVKATRSADAGRPAA